MKDVILGAKKTRLFIQFIGRMNQRHWTSLGAIKSRLVKMSFKMFWDSI